jgi:3-oxoacyl-[acyl-carrier-protein] synthase-1
LKATEKMSDPGEDMFNKVYVVADNITSPLGKTTAQNFDALLNGMSGVRQHCDQRIATFPFTASLFDDSNNITADNVRTRFENLVIASITEALRSTDINITRDDTVLIVSSTKGNISLIETGENTPELLRRVSLYTSADIVRTHFGLKNKPVIISNACISGVLAIITAMRLLRTGRYQNAIVAGADEVSKFVVSGFESFKALSTTVCKPFDALRDGLNLGEGAGTIILSSNEKYNGNTQVLGGAVSNDANHISGPSRTGEELSFAINTALKDAGIDASDIDFISAHGTATPYNDEMEATAITLSGLQRAPLNSLKGYYGHTLGAAGIVESVISLRSLQEGIIMPTPGFKQTGVTNPVNVLAAPLTKACTTFLKTASGFGGCNGAVVFRKL